MFVGETLRIPPTRNPLCGFLNISWGAFLLLLYIISCFPTHRQPARHSRPPPSIFFRNMLFSDRILSYNVGSKR